MEIIIINRFIFCLALFFINLAWLGGNSTQHNVPQNLHRIKATFVVDGLQYTHNNENHYVDYVLDAWVGLSYIKHCYKYEERNNLVEAADQCEVFSLYDPPEEEESSDEEEDDKCGPACEFANATLTVLGISALTTFLSWIFFFIIIC